MTTSNHARAVWRMRLGSAFRTALACSMVGCMTLYGPPSLSKELPFPAFSYVTAILIVSDATLGDALRGCWNALCATSQVVPASIMILWLVGPTNFSIGVAAMAVALGAFLVALPECTNLLCKRIAFGQMVIICVGTAINREHTGIVRHPVHVALSTGLGALASVLALLLPYPRLAYFEVRKLCRLYAENASKRINLLITAFSVQDKTTALDETWRAKPIAEIGAKLLQSIRITQEGVLWERPHIRALTSHFIKSGEQLQVVETAMRGMEMALSSCPLFPADDIHEELETVLQEVEEQIGLKLEQIKCFLPSDAMTTPEPKGEPLNKLLASFETINLNAENIASFFFLFCIKLLQEVSTLTQNSKSRMDESRKHYWCLKPKSETVIFALKCSLSLCLAVFFGLVFSKKNGYWSGLTIAISFATERQATFTLSNARTQGTAMGSIYGVLGCFFFGEFIALKVLALLPWIIFTSFLRHSRMYGQAGGMSAIVGALLILGRENYGPPAEFAINRLTEAFIGLFCFVIVELFLQPIRAGTLAKIQASRTLRTLRECINEVTLSSNQKDMPSIIKKMVKNQEKLKTSVNELEKMIGEADLEPNFWFSPFRIECYNKLLQPISKIGDLLFFLSYNIKFLAEATKRCEVDWKELQERINGDLQLLKNTVSSELEYLEKITLLRSFTVVERENESKKVHDDIELEKLPSVDECKIQIDEELDPEKTLKSLVRCSEEVIEKIWNHKGEEERSVREMCLYLSVLGFCISGLIRETGEIEKGVIDLVRWENPSGGVNGKLVSRKYI